MVPRKFTVPRKEIKPEQATSGSAVREHIPRPVLSSSSQVILPRFQPVLDRIDSHKKRKYQEGYFLKLDDQDIDGKPSSNRAWTECFAQLIGTVLHLWDATELDVATEDGEVKQQLFLNLTDASLKMIETLPTKSGPLQNILSISSAGRNRYLLHFNGHHSMVQWTAAMRLTMFEHQILQEAYTSSLISNETDAWGRNSPVLSSLMKKRSTAKHEGWVRIRFGAGTTWRRCWTVVKPPDDKKYLKLRREYQKAGHPPEMEPPMLKGHIKFYDVKSKRKTPPIAEIKNATYAYAVYPEQAALVESSTLIKMEGTITVFSSRPTSVESYVFAMPDLHAGKTGYITMVQWLFPIWDTFALYGRPEVIGSKYTDNPASTLPKDWDGHVSYSYMEVRDVVGLIMTEGSATWKESEWRQRLKETDAQRMLTKDVDPPT
ncbi:hypothetical protein DL98DRAFT_430794 [Cadophora sp. DSE1049]|nr:hypothetical protein DL98DRAFT_430794 [Cadophora sp. DSE1049]